MSNKNIESKQLTRIDGLVIEDIIETSDAEIMSEAKEDYSSVADVIQHIKGLVTTAVASSRKSRLVTAQKELESHNVQNKQGNVLSFSLNAKKQLIESAKNHADGLTLAARNEEEMSESDTDTMLQDLMDLGIIDEDGKLK